MRQKSKRKIKCNESMPRDTFAGLVNLIGFVVLEVMRENKSLTLASFSLCRNTETIPRPELAVFDLGQFDATTSIE